jgi:hypothetical protein
LRGVIGELLRELLADVESAFAEDLRNGWVDGVACGRAG